MKCSICDETITGDVYAVCPACYHDKPRIIRDEDLRDEVAKEVLKEFVRTRHDYYYCSAQAFELANCWMAERKKQREAK